MGNVVATPNTSSRRLFFGNGLEYFQIFSISQNQTDASIYFSAPLFEEIQWHVPAIGVDEKPVLVSYQIAAPGKLSLHGSGIVHVKPFGTVGSNEFAIRGNILRSDGGKVLSVRHLLTIFPSEPRHKPNSPAGARQTDDLMTTKQWHPYVLIFWAVPLTRSFNVNVTCSFHVDDLEEVPPDSGWGGFNLAMHAIICFAYRTKHMGRWPHNSQGCYSDGHAVPLYIGTGTSQFRLEYRQPSYQLNNDELRITL